MEVHKKQTLEDIYNKSKTLPSGCIIYPYHTSIYVDVEGTSVYLIKAIFSTYGKQYNGKIVRTCNNKQCINPDHLQSPTPIERFWSNVKIKGRDDCWEWYGLSGTRTYANTRFNGKRVRSHRVAWELSNDCPVPDGMDVCHTCDNPPCCNPNHLFVGTHQDNVDDREKKGRNKLPHSLGEQQGSHKLTENDVRQIRMLYSSGNETYRSLASKFHVTFGNIRNIIKRRIWGWLL